MKLKRNRDGRIERQPVAPTLAPATMPGDSAMDGGWVISATKKATSTEQFRVKDGRASAAFAACVCGLWGASEEATPRVPGPKMTQL